MLKTIGLFIYSIFRGIVWFFYGVVWLWFWPIPEELEKNWISRLRKLLKSNKKIIISFFESKTGSKSGDVLVAGTGNFLLNRNAPQILALKKQFPNTVIYQISFADAHRLFQSEKIPKDDYSLAFVKKGRPFLYTEEPVTQSQKLVFAKEYFEGRDDRNTAKVLGFSYVYAADLLDLQ